MNKKVIIIGSAWPLRAGGLATFNERLAKQFIQEGFDTSIYTFSLQYPNFLFPGSTQLSKEPAPIGLKIKSCINSINPMNWFKVGNELRKLKPDFIVVRFWMPFFGPCLGTILRIVNRNKFTQITCIADNVIPHEKRMGDTVLTKYFFSSIHRFVTMSEKVNQDLKTFTHKPSVNIVHPIYDNFGDIVSKEESRKHLGLPVHEKIILFFGFIRKYKGLDLLLEAMNNSSIREANIKLLIAGEFYDNKEEYESIISKYNLANALYLRTQFIDNSEVKYYLGASDFVIQPYKHATQSGVTPLAYHFEKPMLVTNVGGLAGLVPHLKVGVVTEPNAHAIASGIIQLYELGETHFLKHLCEEKKKFSWDKLTTAIIENK
ncbi:MAG: glycosyltransferase [Chitinophagaceae bacterium]|nr:glycosyltransferase [Chitinophagaceae bacterium]